MREAGLVLTKSTVILNLNLNLNLYACRLVERMREAGVKPDHTVFHLLLRAYAYSRFS